METRKQISVSIEIYNTLVNLKHPGQSLDGVMVELLDKAGIPILKFENKENTNAKKEL